MPYIEKPKIIKGYKYPTLEHFHSFCKVWAARSFARYAGYAKILPFYPRLTPGATLFCPLRGLTLTSHHL